MNRMYETCMRLGCQERAKGGVECHETCVRAAQSARPPVEIAGGSASRGDLVDAFAYMLSARTHVLGVDPAYGDDCGAEVDAVVHSDGRLEILAVRHTPPTRPTLFAERSNLISRQRPRASAGVRTMAELMRRSRVDRDFGGVEDA